MEFKNKETEDGSFLSQDSLSQYLLTESTSQYIDCLNKPRIFKIKPQYLNSRSPYSVSKEQQMLHILMNCSKMDLRLLNSDILLDLCMTLHNLSLPKNVLKTLFKKQK